jgi:hypothetical protein
MIGLAGLGLWHRSLMGERMCKAMALFSHLAQFIHYLLISAN